MRRKVKRDLLFLPVIALVIAGIILVNGFYQRSGNAAYYDNLRRQAEATRTEAGLELMNWNLLRKTKGGYWTGPTFHEQLLPRNGEKVDIIGYMVPDNQFRNITEFLLLPLPIECYFCESPPMRDVVKVVMAEGKTADLVNEPMLINGDFTLYEGKKVDFFYSLENASIGPGTPGASLTKRDIKMEHVMESTMQNQDEEELLDPQNVDSMLPGTGQ